MSIVEPAPRSAESPAPTPEPRRARSFSDPQILMAHGAGGIASRRLLEELILPELGSSFGGTLGDSAWMESDGGRIAVTSDAFVVRPLRFPGGSIGELAVNGTVNDLLVAGARPRALVVAFVLEAGLDTRVLAEEVRAMADAAGRAGVVILGGDTKVVEHGKADGMYVATAGIGAVDPRLSLSAASVRPGDRILVSGPIGDHGITVLLARGEIDLETDLRSDTRSIEPLVAGLLDATSNVRWMRDPTRGGVATALSELARDTGLGVRISEERVPVRDQVRGACELLGLDPLHIANEGQFLAVVPPEEAQGALESIRAVSGGESASIIGEIRAEHGGVVLGVSAYGGTRSIDMLVGDPLPRIC